MKKSVAVTLVVSGSLLVGCDRDGRDGVPSGCAGQSLTNNTYQPGYGYWHSYYHRWYPFPHNLYREGAGYYYGGSWWSEPDTRPTLATVPSSYGSSGGHSSHWGWGSGSSWHSSISRGGFGSSAHSASS